MHNVDGPGSLEGQAKISIQKLQWPANDKVDYTTLLNMYRSYPKLFQPAFFLQDAMMVHINGLRWWTTKVSHRIVIVHIVQHVFKTY